MEGDRCLFKGKAALYEERGWDGARGNSRMKLLYQLQGTFAHRSRQID
jgi:hypothetical protein